MNPKKFSVVSSNDSSTRIRVMTDLTLLKGALADRTRKFKGNSQRDDGIWCNTRQILDNGTEKDEE